MDRWGQGLMALGAAVGIPIGLPIALADGGLGLSADAGKWITLASALVFVAGLVIFLLARAAQPRLILHAFHVERVSFGFPTDVLCMRLLNKPRRRSRGAAATGVTATFRCEGDGTEQLPALDARWSDTPQPPNLQPNETPQLAVDVNVNSQRQINLVVKRPDSDDCYLFNNDSYYLPSRYRGENPAWRLSPGKYRAVVEISGDGLRSKSFECWFVNHGQGGSLEVLSFRDL